MPWAPLRNPAWRGERHLRTILRTASASRAGSRAIQFVPPGQGFEIHRSAPLIPGKDAMGFLPFSLSKLRIKDQADQGIDQAFLGNLNSSLFGSEKSFNLALTLHIWAVNDWNPVRGCFEQIVTSRPAKTSGHDGNIANPIGPGQFTHAIQKNNLGGLSGRGMRRFQL